MISKSKKSESPACACGKVDLYEKWLKQNEQKEKEEAASPNSQADDQISSSDAAGSVDKKAVPTKK
jgi:hypothetical protein